MLGACSIMNAAQPHMPHIKTLATYDLPQNAWQNDRLVTLILTVYQTISENLISLQNNCKHPSCPLPGLFSHFLSNFRHLGPKLGVHCPVITVW